MIVGYLPTLFPAMPGHNRCRAESRLGKRAHFAGAIPGSVLPAIRVSPDCGTLSPQLAFQHEDEIEEGPVRGGRIGKHCPNCGSAGVPTRAKKLRACSA